MDIRLNRLHTLRVEEANRGALKWLGFAVLASLWLAIGDTSFIEGLPAVAVMGGMYYAVFF